MTTSVSPQSPRSYAVSSKRKGLLFYVGRVLKWFGIVLVALAIFGAIYQIVAAEIDRRTYSPRGQLYTVNGHSMHLVCMGKGSPAVILQAGATADSLWWYRVQRQLAAHTQVCAFDRPGMGWSDAVSGSRDPLTINRELNALIQQAGISGSYVMAGHSFGAILTRIYAAQYAQEVSGIVLVDSQPVVPKHFASQSDIDLFKLFFDVTHITGSVLMRLGLARLTGTGDFQRSGYPTEIVPELVFLRSRSQVMDAYYAENGPAFPALQEASAGAENLGDLPILILWAQQTYEDYQHNPQLRLVPEEFSGFSNNNTTRIVEGADHGSILGNELYAQQVSNAILDLIQAVQSGEKLAR